jgi:HAMP domain-containing protein
MEKLVTMWDHEPALTETEQMRDKINELVNAVNQLIDINERLAASVTNARTDS